MRHAEKLLILIVKEEKKMAEYIERKVLEDVMAIMGANETQKDRRVWARAISLLHDVPTADVAPVVHGRWDNIPNTYMSVISKDRAYHGNATTCSLCHEVNPNAYKTNYCPNCGAKMDKE